MPARLEGVFDVRECNVRRVGVLAKNCLTKNRTDEETPKKRDSKLKNKRRRVRMANETRRETRPDARRHFKWTVARAPE